MASIFSDLVSPSLLPVWEVAEFSSIIIVGVGCWGEVWAEHHKFADDLNDILASDRRNKFWVRFFWLMVVWGLALELVAFGFAFMASNKEIEGLQHKVEDLRASNDALEAQIQPRRITPEQKNKIIRDLYAWRFIEDKCSVKIWVQRFDVEANVFASQIAHILADDCGFKVEFNADVASSSPLTFGTQFWTHDPAPAGARAISRALKELPLNPMDVELQTNFQNDVLQINVHTKPMQ